jgi:hypothetical protein
MASVIGAQPPGTRERAIQQHPQRRTAQGTCDLLEPTGPSPIVRIAMGRDEHGAEPVDPQAGWPAAQRRSER